MGHLQPTAVDATLNENKIGIVSTVNILKQVNSSQFSLQCHQTGNYITRFIIFVIIIISIIVVL